MDNVINAFKNQLFVGLIFQITDNTSQRKDNSVWEYTASACITEIRPHGDDFWVDFKYSEPAIDPITHHQCIGGGSLGTALFEKFLTGKAKVLPAYPIYLYPIEKL